MHLLKKIVKKMSQKLQIKKYFIDLILQGIIKNLSQQINGNDLTYNFKKI